LSNPDGSYIEVTNSKKKNSIQVSDYLNYSSVVFYCAVYDYSSKTIVGNLSWLITSETSASDVEIAYDGDDTFRYDANGDTTIENAEKTRALKVSITWQNHIATSYDI
jgi:hypothetical protein